MMVPGSLCGIRDSVPFDMDTYDMEMKNTRPAALRAAGRVFAVSGMYRPGRI